MHRLPVLRNDHPVTLALDQHQLLAAAVTVISGLVALDEFDIGAIPDPKNVYNDKISMNKVFEYMSLGIPFVQFDLVEGRKAAGDAALYAGDNSPIKLAEQIGRLIDQPALREQLARIGQERARLQLNWDVERAELLRAYERALSRLPQLARPREA